MENLFRFLRTLRFLLRFYQWTHVPDWEKVDAENLHLFMQSTAGKKLALRLRNASLRHNASAVQDTNIHRCGIAAGYMLCLSDLSALSVYGEPDAANQGTLQSEDRAQEGEDEFFERMSP